MFGLVSNCFVCIVAVFAYFIAPDPSPYANRIILEIGGEKPGFTQQFYKSKESKTLQSAGLFLSSSISGKDDEYYYVPIISS